MRFFEFMAARSARTLSFLWMLGLPPAAGPRPAGARAPAGAAAGSSFKDKIGSFLLQSLDVFYRFPITTIFIITLSIINIVYIIIDDFNGNLEGAFALGAITALLAELVIERGMVQRKIALPLPFAFTAIAFTLLQVFDNAYIPIGVGGVGVAVFAAIFYALYKEKEQPILSHLVKSAFICGIFTGIVFSGFTTCILAFNYLIFKFDESF